MGITSVVPKYLLECRMDKCVSVQCDQTGGFILSEAAILVTLE